MASAEEIRKQAARTRKANDDLLASMKKVKAPKPASESSCAVTAFLALTGLATAFGEVFS